MLPQHSTRPVIICPQCGTLFTPYPSAIKRGGGKYCSRDCYAKTVKGRPRKPQFSSLAEAFWAHVEKTESCWFWTGSLTQQGYGRLNFAKRHHKAHRLSYELAKGPLAPGLCACHSCDINYPPGDTTYRRCVNPDHLFAGTNTENMADRDAKGRQAKGDRSGSRVRPERLARGECNGMYTHPESRVAFKGERHGLAKLTTIQVLAIRDEAGLGHSHGTLASKYGVARQTITGIVGRKKWTHI